MNKRQERNLEVLSRIDESVVEWSGKKRATLKTGKPKKSPQKKWYVIAGSAAALLLVLGAVLLIVKLIGGQGGVKHVPVYTGMTVSDTASVTVASLGHGSVPELNAEGNNGLHKGHYKGDSKDNSAEDSFDKPIEDSLHVTGGTEERYYAKPNEDVYITVHVENPDNFEILSFTLNDKVYSSYMFEAGSDMENLILKVNVGDVEGVIEYTIDAIKYVDGTEIKDVRMDGDRTVEIGVYIAEQPTAAISGEALSFRSVSFTVTAEDLKGLVQGSEGKLEAVLYDGNQIVARQDVATTGNTNVTFDGLEINATYQYAIVASYDALDGTGYNSYVLAKKSFRTVAVLLFDQVTLSTTGISFSLDQNESANDVELSDILVYRDGAVVQDLSASATSVSDLLPDTSYVLEAVYWFANKQESIYLEFTTDPLTYTVNHLLERTDGDYEQADSTVDVIALGAQISPAVNSYTGFDAPTVQTVTGLLGEVLEVNYRYSRTLYTLTFVRNDGEVPDTAQIKYGHEIPGDVREHFGGWFADAGLSEIVYTVPAENQTLYAKWDHWTSADQLLYVGSETLIVTGLKEGASLTDLVIPAYIGGKRVAAVAERAFQYQEQLLTVTVPETVTRIGLGAFGNCHMISSLTLPFAGASADGSGATYIGHAFGASEAEGNALSLPDSLQTITLTGTTPVADKAFMGCTGLKTVVIGAVPMVGTSAFEGCTQLITVSLSEGLTTIEENAFRYCAALTAIEIPASVTTVESRLFYDCKSLKTAIFKGNKITQLSGNIFHGCELLENVNLPSEVTSLPYGFFYGCAALKNVTVPASVTKIHNDVFLGCTALSRVNFNGTLSEWVSIEFIDADSNPLFCGAALYIDNVNVTQGTLTIPADVTSIGAYAFCGTAITGLVIPEGVTGIGAAAFENCTALVSISFNATAMNALLEDTFSAAGTAGEGIAVTFGEGVTRVPEKIFAHYGAEGKSAPNIKSVSFAANSACLYINQGAFANCATLSSVTLPEKLQRINVDAFYHNAALISVNIPASVTFIGGSAFASCAMLKTVSFAAEQADYLEIGKNAFADCTKLEGVSLPRLLKTIDEKAFRNCSSLATLKLPNTVRSIAKAAFQSCTALEEVVISDPGVAFTIGDEVFLGCTALKTVEIAASMNTLSMDSFNGCTSLTTVRITGNINHIGTRAFAGCIKLSDVSLPSCLIRIRDEAFKGCTSLTTISLPEGLTELQNSSFRDSGLTAIELPESVTVLGASTFRDCKSLESVIFKGDGIKSFDGYIFYGCEKLKNISLPPELKNIAYNTFYNCTSLESVTIPATVTQISPYAFDGCTALNNVYFKGTVEQWNAISFDNEKSNPCYYAKHLWIGGVDVLATKAT